MPDATEQSPVGYLYDGARLVAIGYDRALVEHWRNSTGYTVEATPRGEGDD